MWGDEITRAVMCCGIVVMAAEPLTIPLLRRLAAMDMPGLRSSHTVPTPRGGGLPIVAGLLVAVILVRGAEAVPFGAAIGFFGALGFVDDLRGLTAIHRLLLQCAGSAAIAALLITPLHLPVALLPALIFVTAVWLMGFVNAFNFMDGVNGISGAHAVIAGVAYACFGQWRQDPFLVAMGLAVAVGALAFLPWNAVRARVFLGDVGSYALGAALAVLAVTAITHGVPARGSPRTAGPLRGGHRLDPAAADPGRRALDPGAPDPHLPALVRRGLDASGGDAADLGGHDPRLPARDHEPDREPAAPAGL